MKKKVSKYNNKENKKKRERIKSGRFLPKSGTIFFLLFGLAVCFSFCAGDRWTIYQCFETDDQKEGDEVVEYYYRGQGRTRNPSGTYQFLVWANGRPVVPPGKKSDYPPF